MKFNRRINKKDTHKEASGKPARVVQPLLEEIRHDRMRVRPVRPIGFSWVWLRGLDGAERQQIAPLG